MTAITLTTDVTWSLISFVNSSMLLESSDLLTPLSHLLILNPSPPFYLPVPIHSTQACLSDFAAFRYTVCLPFPAANICRFVGRPLSPLPCIHIPSGKFVNTVSLKKAQPVGPQSSWFIMDDSYDCLHFWLLVKSASYCFQLFESRVEYLVVSTVSKLYYMHT